MAKATCVTCGETFRAQTSWSEKPPPPYCPKCIERARVATDVASTDRFIMVTGDVIPGYQIANVLGLVAGIGHPSDPVLLEKSATRSDWSMREAQKDMRERAIAMGADAVVGVRHAVYSGSGRVGQAVGVQLLGTAVTLEADDRPPAPTA